MNKSLEQLTNQSGSPYLIAEIGINHNGDISIAKKLIDAANACDWHCAKFQKRDPDICVPSHQKSIQRNTPWGKMSYLDYKHKVEFNKTEYNIIERYCDGRIPWTVSVWDLNSLSFIQNYEVPFIKIPSALITNLELIEEASKTKIPIIINISSINSY